MERVLLAKKYLLSKHHPAIGVVEEEATSVAEFEASYVNILIIRMLAFKVGKNVSV